VQRKPKSLYIAMELAE